MAATMAGTRKASSSRKLTAPIPSSTASKAPAESSGACSSASGCSIMPTETKNSAAKIRCSGIDSAAAWWPRSLSPSRTPAKKAPSAKETLKSSAAA